MPTSRFSQLNEVMEAAHYLRPQSVLDVGFGFGKYGYLLREFLELWDGRGVYGDWQRRIDGIEVFEPYVTAVHRQIYSRVFIGNALDVVPRLEAHYDLALLIDVLEHFGREEGVRLLEALREKATNLLISTPHLLSPQAAAFGNVFETHKFQWREEHLRGRGGCCVIPNEASLIVVLGPGGALLADLVWNWPRRLQRSLPFLKPLCRRLWLRKLWRAGLTPWR